MRNRFNDGAATIGDALSTLSDAAAAGLASAPTLEVTIPVGRYEAGGRVNSLVATAGLVIALLGARACSRPNVDLGATTPQQGVPTATVPAK